MTTYTTLRAANVARQKEWDPSDKITLSFRGNEMGGECGEAQNVIKKIDRERMGIRGSRDTIEHLAEELADVVICADLIAMHEGINLDAAVNKKFNATSEKNCLATRLVEHQQRPPGLEPWMTNGFRDGNNRLVQPLDVVDYHNGRRGILIEALQDGDAEVLFRDSRKHEMVKWKYLCKVPLVDGG